MSLSPGTKTCTPQNVPCILKGQVLATFTVRPVAPAVEKTLLKRRGAAPFNIGNQNIATLLGNAYDVVDVAARRKMMEE